MNEFSLKPCNVLHHLMQRNKINDFRSHTPLGHHAVEGALEAELRYKHRLKKKQFPHLLCCRRPWNGGKHPGASVVEHAVF